MKRNLLLILCAFSFLFFASCKKEKDNLTESVSIKSASVPTSLSTVVVEATSQITITMSKSFKTQATPLMLSPAFDLVSGGYTISPASGTAVSFGTPSVAVAPVVYTLTSPSGVKRLYSVRVLFHATL